MTFPYAQENTESRRRLESIVRRLTDTDLALSTDYGWTVAALLAIWLFGINACLSFSIAGRRVDLMNLPSMRWQSTIRLE